MKTRIKLIDLITNEKETVISFSGSIEELEKRLIELQSGYCEDEKPKIHKFKNKHNREFLYTTSDCDFSYSAQIS